MNKLRGFSVVFGNVLVSKNARISRPNKKINELECIVKTDQFISHIEKLIDNDYNPLVVAKMVSADTVEKLARDLVKQHKPIKFNWSAKFGLSDDKENYSEQTGVDQQKIEIHDDQKKKLVCHSCREQITYKVGVFCWNNKKRFGGNAYCFDCQKNVS